MAILRSIRFFSRARTTEQRGFALVTAIVLAVLYFALMELLLLDSARQLQAAQRFRARIVATALAENAAELVFKTIVPVQQDDWQGEMSGRMKSTGGNFEIDATGKTAGVVNVKANVWVKGSVSGTNVRIDYTQHSQ